MLTTIAILLGVLVGLVEMKIQMCGEPNINQLDASFYMIQQLQTGDMDIQKDREITIHGSRSCTRTVQQTREQKGNLNYCPTFYVLNFNPDRIPSMVVEARCSCKKCQGPGMPSCEPQYYYRSIRTFNKGKKCYGRVIKRFQNGCVCREGTSEPRSPPAPER